MLRNHFLILQLDGAIGVKIENTSGTKGNVLDIANTLCMSLQDYIENTTAGSGCSAAWNCSQSINRKC